MASHGIARSRRVRTEEQKLQDLEKIRKYRDLEDQIRDNIAKDNLTVDVFQLTSRLLKLNPEYYTIWNDRRRLLISGLLSKPSAGSWPSKASPSSSRTVTTTPSSAAFSSSSSATTPPDPASRTAGRSGITADDGGTETKSELGDGDKDQPATAAAAAPDEDQAVLRAELAFTIPLLKEYPKCYWIWNYRRWVLQQAIERLDRPAARVIWKEELGLIENVMLATRDQRNFHAWAYRRDVVAQLESTALEGQSRVEGEFDFSNRMLRLGLSNFSAWHNRTQLIPVLLKEGAANDSAKKKFLDDELAFVRGSLEVTPDDQSLWYYHQYLILHLTEHVGGEKAAYITREIDYIKGLLEMDDDIKWIYEVLLEYAVTLPRLEARQPTPEELRDLTAWLDKLKELDPMRSGRWKDLEMEISTSPNRVGNLTAS